MTHVRLNVVLDDPTQLQRDELRALSGGLESANVDAVICSYSPAGGVEPMVLGSWLASLTDNLGLIVAAPTTFAQPYNVARRCASLDHISNGRAGWLIETDPTELCASPYQAKPTPREAVRLARAEEFVEVCVGLWQGWSRLAIGADADGKARVDAAEVQALDHQGEFFAVAGPLDIPCPPQRVLPLAHRPRSEAGMKFAAKHADIVFVAAQTRHAAGEIGKRLTGLLTKFGRKRDVVSVVADVPAVPMAVGQTADLIESWFRAGAVDGFNLRLAGGGSRKLLAVVAELQSRGLLAPARGTCSTLRSRYGLRIPTT